VQALLQQRFTAGEIVLNATSHACICWMFLCSSL